jgi:hypothetical protein
MVVVKWLVAGFILARRVGVFFVVFVASFHLEIKSLILVLFVGLG